ncbi:MAG: acyl-CoA dehydrogenase family protein [Halieaceae bacterium]|jgi:alkylation response protein AidB-like acyl-CoA dehydrogenase|nr:acyl-CoA dehydrogenase family protein [Halieaceae bacterium]
MDFGFSETQREVQQLARKILGEQVTADKLAQYDEYAAERFDRTLWGQLAEAGLLGVAIDQAHGGMGLGFFELALLVEEAGRVLAPLPLVPHAVSTALAVQAFGTEAQQASLLPGAAEGSLLLTAALSEATNEDPARPTATSAVAAAGGYRLTGVKTCVPNARSATAILASAATPDGPVAVLVDPMADGVSFRDVHYTTYEPLVEMHLDEVLIGADGVLAGPETGAAVMQWVAEHTTAALCAHQLGVTDVAMRMTASYTAEREQFGVPVATFQAVGHRAANCFIDVECLRLNTYQAVSLLDAGSPATTEVQIAKIWAGDVGHRVSYAAQHLHGGTGIDRDYPLWRYCLWARHNEAMLGGSARQLAALGRRIAAGEAHCR